MDPIQTAIAAITLPHTQRSLGSEKALVSAEVRGNDLHVVLRFAYPVVHLQAALLEAIAATTGYAAANIQLHIDSHIAVHKVQQGVNTIAGVKNIIAVASGKGGVGKSTTTVNLALALQKLGLKVGVLDADIYGPSIPTMLGNAGKTPMIEAEQFVPLDAFGMPVLSIGHLTGDHNTPVAWRGPKATGALMQLFNQTLWPDLDVLMIDMPPGTGDIQLTLAQRIPVTGAVIVTTPQNVALMDAVKGIELFNRVQIPVMGVIENMSTHICSNCGYEEQIFGQGGGDKLAEQYDIPLLGRLPLNVSIRENVDAGTPSVIAGDDAADSYIAIAQQIAKKLPKAEKDQNRIF